MPSIYTHYIFANDVYNKLSKKDKNLIDLKRDYYNMFSQSFDNFYYYNFLNLKTGNEYRKFGRYAHGHKCGLYFKNMLKYIKEKDLRDNPEVMSYLYGSINHYASDSTLHPYINYRTGRYDENRKTETRKYRGVHTYTELQIDAYYYEKRTGESYKHYKIYKDLMNPLFFSEELVDCMNDVYLNTFKKENAGIVYNNSYNQSRFIYKYLMYDPFGIKNICYKAVDILIPNKKDMLTAFSMFKKPVNEEFFNLEHQKWNSPSDDNLIYETSWFDEYENAINRSLEMIQAANKYLNGKSSLEDTMKIIKNNSYATNMDCKTKHPTLYFRY